MVRSQLDHIVVTAPSLEAGVAYVGKALGVSPQAGGEHPRMGSHNCLLKLGEKLYLEVIAVNPQAPAPQRPRWFQLDTVNPSRPARLAAWVARTNDIRAAITASPIPLGTVEPMSRGQLNWLITVSADGSMPLDGVAPALIQWPEGVHPGAGLRESGCSLVRLEAFHPQAREADAMLTAIGFEGDVRVSALPAGREPYLVAHIQTAAGMRRLGSRE
jgi:hypothetical protein